MLDIASHLATASVSDALKSTSNFFLKGGWFMVPLCITSVVGMMAVIYKFLSLTEARIIPADLAHKVEDFESIVASDRAAPVLLEFQQGESSLARLCHVAVKHRGKSVPDIVHAVEASAREEASRLHSGIGVIDTVTTIAPLLGLLGTASGLVTIFEGLSDASNYMAIARGIAEAMTTTIAGLAIAVPGVIAHGYFTRRIDVYTARLESLLADLANHCRKADS